MTGPDSAPKTGDRHRKLKIALAISGSFTALVALIVLLLVMGKITFQLALLMLVAMLGLYVGSGSSRLWNSYPSGQRGPSNVDRSRRLRDGPCRMLFA